eukprot:CAMPEP_0116868948 /NCGR_PEP_ID=MMETSP0418-20121206/27487_1 /TAXON_ID=1158023 /ORGANISM="Astrosyne radiata, Strain 13vi08-1A" /LENGTH=114 /DNA_ID=CAMNT_0004504989 /DNA_START=814 /DNA_END=1158 /DNA_ORIENTATION=+
MTCMVVALRSLHNNLSHPSPGVHRGWETTAHSNCFSQHEKDFIPSGLGSPFFPITLDSGPTSLTETGKTHKQGEGDWQQHSAVHVQENKTPRQVAKRANSTIDTRARQAITAVF